jgi:hypothetical protein
MIIHSMMMRSGTDQYVLSLIEGKYASTLYLTLRDVTVDRYPWSEVRVLIRGRDCLDHACFLIDRWCEKTLTRLNSDMSHLWLSHYELLALVDGPLDIEDLDHTIGHAAQWRAAARSLVAGEGV